MANTGALTVLLLFICPTLIQSQEVKYIARSSDVTFDFGPCARNQVFKLQNGGATAYIPCNSNPQIPHRWEGRISINKTTGSITLPNVTRSDAGYYTLVRTNGNGKNENLPRVEVRVLDPIWIHELFCNCTVGTISLSRCHAEDPGEIIWTIDGRDLLDQRWLSPDNWTLTIPYNDSGVITVSNLVSADNKSITVIRDLNGESGHLGHVLSLNITRVIWGHCGDEPTMGALLLPRNISTIYVLLTPSEEMREPQCRSWKRFAWGAALEVIIILVIAGLYLFLTCKKKAKLTITVQSLVFEPFGENSKL